MADKQQSRSLRKRDAAKRYVDDTPGIQEELKLEFIKEIGFCHMRILDGLDSLLQLSGLIGKLCCNAGAVRK